MDTPTPAPRPSLAALVQRIPVLFKAALGKAKAGLAAVRPGPSALRGAAAGALALALVVFLFFVATASTGPLAPGLVVGLAMTAAGLLLAFLGGQGVAWAIDVLHKIPFALRWALLGGMVLLSFPMGSWKTSAMLASAGLLLGLGVLAGAGLASALRDWPALSAPRRAAAGVMLGLGAVGIAAVLGWYLWPGQPPEPVTNAALESGAPVERVTLPNPADPGPYPVQTLTYGAGTDRFRPEFGAGAALKTGTVDGSVMLDDAWKGLSGDLRRLYWGFGPDALPLNARVWYPGAAQGQPAGPYPLVVMVHGNHLTSDFSDPGYAYLGELLASRGMIAVSVDENFLNSGMFDFFKGFQNENDARGWLLLEHIRLFQGWTSDPASPFHGLVDTGKIAVMGHSRGGEAAAVAAAFNRLPVYPDNADLRFDYNYNIRAVVAIAPIDGQYAPTWRLTPLEDVNYFTLHGSHDSDVISFDGLNLYERLRLDPAGDWFKAALWIYRANHGQFNTTWGDSDQGLFGRGLLNRAALLPADDQRRAAQVYISAFLEAALNGQRGYLPLFRDSRAAPEGWLPDTIYTTRFEQSGAVIAAGYEEDIDVSTGSLPGVSIRPVDFNDLREKRVDTKWGGAETNGVYLGWDEAKSPVYTVMLPTGFALEGQTRLVFALADANQDPPPAPDAAPREGPRPAVDLSVALVDASGGQASLPLGAYRLVQPQIAVSLYKLDLFERSARSEPLLQSFAIPLADFARANPALDLTRPAAVRFLFDRTERGSVILDGIGFE